MKSKYFKITAIIYALLCCLFDLMLLVMSACGYIISYSTFNIGSILLYVSIILKVVLLIIDRHSIAGIFLILSLLYPKFLLCAYITSILLIFAVLITKFSRKDILFTAILSLCITMITSFIFFLPIGNFVTHTDCKAYPNDDNSKVVIVSYDYSLEEKILGIPYLCDGDSSNILGNIFYKKIDDDHVKNLPSKFVPTESGKDVIWIDNDTVVIGSITVDVDK